MEVDKYNRFFGGGREEAGRQRPDRNRSGGGLHHAHMKGCCIDHGFLFGVRYADNGLGC